MHIQDAQFKLEEEKIVMSDNTENKVAICEGQNMVFSFSELNVFNEYSCADTRKDEEKGVELSYKNVTIFHLLKENVEKKVFS